MNHKGTPCPYEINRPTPNICQVVGDCDNCQIYLDWLRRNPKRGRHPVYFKCNYCPAEFPNMKMLFDHYEEYHAETLKHYRIKYHPNKQVGLARAPSPKLACQRLGWNIKDCWDIEEVKGA